MSPLLASVFVLLLASNADAFGVAPFRQNYVSFALKSSSDSNIVDTVKKGLSDAADSVKEAAQDAAENVQAAVSNAESAAKDFAADAQSTVDNVASQAEGAANQAQEAAQEAVGQVQASVEQERHTMFIGNLPFDASEQDLRDLCASSGTVSSVSIPTNRETGTPRGFAFIDMSTAQELETAVSNVDGATLLGRQVRANKSLPKEELQKQRPSRPKTQKLYVGNLPFDATADDLSEMFGEFGEVTDAFIPTRDGGLSRGFGFVTMGADGSDAAIEELNGIEFDGRQIVVSYPLAPGEKSKTRESGGGDRSSSNDADSDPNNVKLYVGNISFYTSTDTLREVFGEFGTVVDCYMPQDRNTGSPRGFGFVTMAREEAERAVDELDGCEIDGRSITVNEARPKSRQDNFRSDGY